MAAPDRAAETGMPPKLEKDAPSLRISVVASETLLLRLEEWRAEQRPIPNKSEAARMLLEAALDAADKVRSSGTNKR
jgi:hypothetical protein